MPRSGHIADLRRQVGTRRLLVPSVSVILADDRDRILLLRHHDGQRWGTPGGAIEPGERPADAAVREMWEETGLHVEPTALLGVFGGPEHELTYDNGDVTAYVSSAFAVRVVGGSLRLEQTEVTASCWVAEPHRQTLDLTPLTVEILDAAFARLAGPVPDPYFAPATWIPPEPG